jgi:hypothetical protein
MSNERGEFGVFVRGLPRDTNEAGLFLIGEATGQRPSRVEVFTGGRCGILWLETREAADSCMAEINAGGSSIVAVQARSREDRGLDRGSRRSTAEDEGGIEVPAVPVTANMSSPSPKSNNSGRSSSSNNNNRNNSNSSSMGVPPHARRKFSVSTPRDSAELAKSRWAKVANLMIGTLPHVLREQKFEFAPCPEGVVSSPAGGPSRRGSRSRSQSKSDRLAPGAASSAGRLTPGPGIAAPPDPLAPEAHAPPYVPASATSTPASFANDRPRSAQLLFASFNIEWLDKLFDSEDHPAQFVEYRESVSSQGVKDPGSLSRRIARVIKQLDADLLVIIEGPRNERRMKNWVTTFLENEYDVMGGDPASSGAAFHLQQVFLLVRRRGVIARAAENPTATAFFKEPWKVDVDGDCILQFYKFTHTPLAVDVWTKSGVRLTVIALHLKSKYIAGGERSWLSSDFDDRMIFIKEAVRNRRRIQAEVSRVRKMIDHLLFQAPGSNVLVCGDLNDGPGRDYFSENYLSSSCTDALLGSTYNPETLFSHAHLRHVADKARLWTAIHHDFIDLVPDRRLLLDHILISPSLEKKVIKADIAHEIYNAECAGDPLESRLNRPSDHRPVYVTFAI